MCKESTIDWDFEEIRWFHIILHRYVVVISEATERHYNINGTSQAF